MKEPDGKGIFPGKLMVHPLAENLEIKKGYCPIKTQKGKRLPTGNLTLITRFPEIAGTANGLSWAAMEVFTIPMGIMLNLLK